MYHVRVHLRKAVTCDAGKMQVQAMNMHERLTSWALSGGVAHFWLWSGWWGGTGLGGGCGWGRWWVGSSLHWVGWLHGNATLPRSIALVATGQTDVALVTPLVSPAYMVTCISSKAEHHIMLLTYMLVSMSMPLHEYQCMQSYQNLGGSCHAFNNTCAGHSVLCALQGLCALVLTPRCTILAGHKPRCALRMYC